MTLSKCDNGFLLISKTRRLHSEESRPGDRDVHFGNALHGLRTTARLHKVELTSPPSHSVCLCIIVISAKSGSDGLNGLQTTAQLRNQKMEEPHDRPRQTCVREVLIHAQPTDPVPMPRMDCKQQRSWSNDEAGIRDRSLGATICAESVRFRW